MRATLGFPAPVPVYIYRESFISLSTCSFHPGTHLVLGGAVVGIHPAALMHADITPLYKLQILTLYQSTYIFFCLFSFF